MASARASLEAIDLESGAEFERIKQNFRSTVVAPEVAANLPEAQTAFQELQLELQEFLRDHLQKVRDLQGFLSSNVVPTDSTNGAAHNSHGTVTPKNDNRRTMMSLHPPVNDGESLGGDDDAVVSNSNHTHTASNAGIQRSRSANAADNSKAPAVDAHMQALQSFLNAHTENIRSLQNALQGGSVARSYVHGAPPTPYKPGLTEASDSKQFEDFNRQFNMLVVISTFTAALIVAFLSLVQSIIGTTHRTAFNVGMFFALIALLIHLGTIIIAGRGAAIASQQENPKKHDLQFFTFHLATCEQLQFLALILFVVSVVIMTFLIFMSVAFPIVLLFLSTVGILVVFSSAYWEVSLTFRNLQYLVKNVQRLKQSLEYLRIRGRMG